MKSAFGPVLIASMCSVGVAAAQDQPQAQRTGQPAGAVTELDEITVSADRQQSTVFNSPATVSVREAKELDEKNIQSPRDLVRDEPGVSIGSQPTRTGSTNYTIRGIGENRVLLLLDGVKVPDFPASNVGAGTYTRDFVDFDSLKQVEIIRGPASSLYGSDAIGGIVAYVTKDPADYLANTPKNWFVSAKAAYDSTDRSFAQTLTAAGRSGQWETLIVYTHRNGHEVTPNTWRKANPQTYESNSVLGKVVYNSSELGQFKLTGQFTRKTIDTNILTDLTTSVLGSRGQDTNVLPRISFDWNLPLAWAVADNVKTKVYYTAVDRHELTRQDRVSPAGGAVSNRLRLSDFGYQQQVYGAEIQFNAVRTWGDWKHEFVYGATFDNTKTQRPRYRTETNLATNVTTTYVGLEQFPNKNFPDTETTQAAAYVQDTISSGKLRIIPAVRFDYYSLNPKPDAMFYNSNLANFTVERLKATAVSPKLGATYDLTENYRLFGQYAHGFRAPPYDNANFAYSNPAYGYEILPNGNLKPETSDSFEFGLRGKFDNGSSFQLTSFYNTYKNFIDTVVVGISGGGLQQFQYRNLSNVVIWGFEGKGEYRFNTEWSAFANAAYAYGRDQQTGKPIDSVDPFTGLIGVRYQNVANWGFEARQRFAAGKKRVSDPTIATTSGYTVTDLTFFYNPLPNVTINANIYNLFDRSYFNAQDVRGLLTTNANLELFRAPGRTFALNATVRW